MHTRAKRLLVLSIAAAPFLTSSPVYAQSSGSTATIEEVIVTSQRREQSLQEVPISISAFNNTAIETNRITNIVDLGSMVPNLAVVEGAGGTKSATFSMRGLYASGTALGADSGIATYLDGVYLKGGSGMMNNFAELERIEVLRGPQGTLFGRNTSGGAVHFITKKPSGEFGFKQTLTAGNHNLFESKTHVESPQWGPVSASLTYAYSEKDGDIRNKAAGTTFDLTPLGGGIEKSPKRLGDNKYDSIFLAVKLDLIEDLDLVYRFDYMESEQTPLGVGVLDGSPGLINALGVKLNKERPSHVDNPFHLPSEQRAYGHNLTAEYSVNEQVTLRNILAFREQEFETPGFTLDGLGMFSPAVVVFASNGGGNHHQLSNEFQVILDTDPLTLTTGFLYYSITGAAGGYEHAPNAVFGGGGIFPGSTWAKNSTVDAESYAIYSQAEFHVNNQWDIILGGRVTEDKKEYVDRTLMNGMVVEPEYDETEGTYLLGANYKPTDDMMVYAKYSTGYISGGVVSGLEYDPERAKSFEIGGKATWLDGALQTNLALFSVDYEQQQFGTAGTLVTPQVPASQVIVNAGNTSATGAELELVWLPMDKVRTALNLGYLDFDFDSLDVDLLGAATPLTEHLRPQWTGTLMGEYETDPLFGNVSAIFHLDASYRSREYVSTRKAPWTNDETNSDTVRLNGQLTFQGFQVGASELKVALWGRNLTDSDRPANMNLLGPVIAGTYEPARSYGVDVTIEF